MYIMVLISPYILKDESVLRLACVSVVDVVTGREN